MLSIIQFHAGSYRPRSLQVGAGDRSLLRMSPHVERRAPQRKGLVSEEALFWNCPKTPLKSLPCLNSQTPLVYALCTGDSWSAAFSRQPEAGSSPLPAGWASLQREVWLSPWSGLSTLPPGGDLEDRGEEREARLNDLLTRGRGKFLSMGHRGAGLGEERDLHLISCK